MTHGPNLKEGSKLARARGEGPFQISGFLDIIGFSTHFPAKKKNGENWRPQVQNHPPLASHCTSSSSFSHPAPQILGSEEALLCLSACVFIYSLRNIENHVYIALCLQGALVPASLGGLPYPLLISHSLWRFLALCSFPEPGFSLFSLIPPLKQIRLIWVKCFHELPSFGSVILALLFLLICLFITLVILGSSLREVSVCLPFLYTSLWYTGQGE